LSHPGEISTATPLVRDLNRVLNRSEAFWLAKRGMRFEEILALYEKLAARIVDGTIRVEIEAGYPLERIADALAHAQREACGGKVQLRPNGGRRHPAVASTRRHAPGAGRPMSLEREARPKQRGQPQLPLFACRTRLT
jgi:hypothetical protein